MDLSDSPDDAAFRSGDSLEYDDPKRIQRTKDWQRRLHEGGDVAMGWGHKWTVAGMTLRFQDALATNPEQVWTLADCLTSSSGRISCRSLDRTARLKLAPLHGVASGYRVDARLRGRALLPPFAGPVTITLTYGASIDRAGSIVACATTTSGLKCPP